MKARATQIVANLVPSCLALTPPLTISGVSRRH